MSKLFSVQLTYFNFLRKWLLLGEVLNNDKLGFLYLGQYLSFVFKYSWIAWHFRTLYLGFSIFLIFHIACLHWLIYYLPLLHFGQLLLSTTAPVSV